MDLTKTGKIFNLERFSTPRPKQAMSLSTSSFMEVEQVGFDLDLHNRFEQVFLASPRAQELYSTIEKAKGSNTLSQETTVASIPGFDEVVNMAQFFHNKSSQNLSVSSLTLEKPTWTARDKDFEVSPFKPCENDSEIKRKVSMVINKLGHTPDNSLNKNKPNSARSLHHGMAFNDTQSDSGVSVEGSSSKPIPRQRDLFPQDKEKSNLADVHSAKISATAPWSVDKNQEAPLESDSEEEVDVVSEDVREDKEAEHISANENHNVIGGDLLKTCGQTLVEDDEHDLEMVNGEQENGLTSAGTQNQDDLDSRSGDTVPETPQDSAKEKYAIIVTNSGKKTEESQEKQDKDNNKEKASSPVDSPEKRQEKTRPKTHTLHEWSIKALKTRTHMGIIVEGQRSEDSEGELWHSTAIVKRLNSRCVQTKSGSQYVLVGPLDEKTTLAQGFARKFVKAFRNGFPSNWLAHVSNHFQVQSSSEGSEEEKETQQVERAKKKKTPNNHSTLRRTVTPSDQKKETKNSKDFKTPENRAMPKEVELQRTRSGRMVKPPLAWWRGQRILTDRNHNLEGIAPGGEEHTPLSAMYNIEIKIPLLAGREGDTGQCSSLELRVLKADVDTSDEASRKIHSKQVDPRNMKPKDSLDHVDRKHTMKTAFLKSKEKSFSSAGSKVTQKKEDKKDEVLQRSSSRRRSTYCPSAGEETSTDEVQRPASKQSAGKVQLAKKHSMSLVDTEKKRVGRPGDVTETGESSDSCPERADDEVLKKQLFLSPKHTNNKKGKIQEISNRMRDNRGQSDGWCKESSACTVQENTERELSASEYEITRDSKVQQKARKVPVTRKSVQQNDENGNGVSKGESNSDSESQGTERTVAIKSPLPSKRILRSHRRKANDTMQSNRRVFSEVDSEDQKQDQKHNEKSIRQRVAKNHKGKNADSDSRFSSCDEITSDTGQSKNFSMVQSKKKTVQKKPVLKRILEIAKETTDSQTSEEESDTTLKKQSKRQQANRRPSKISKQNDPSQSKTVHSKRKKPAVSKGSIRDESDSDTVVSKKMSKTSSVKTRNNENYSKVISEDMWDDDEIQRLNEALYAIPANIPLFWHKIATCVQTRTAQECQFQHQGHALLPSKKETSRRNGLVMDKKKSRGQKVNPKQTVNALSGGVGTIKRKRELRQLLEQQDVNYEDDIFDATPFKRKKNLKLPFNLNCKDSDDDDDDEDDGDDNDEDDNDHEAVLNLSSKTPSSRTPSSRFRPLGPLSTSTTPGADFISPSLLQQVNRKDMDHYIYRMQQGKRGTQAVAKQKGKLKTSTPKKKGTSHEQWPALDMELFETQPTSDQESEEEDEDYYFSDE